MDREKIEWAIGKLTISELHQLELAAIGHNHGGIPVLETILKKVVQYGLVFKSSGRLKPEVINYLLNGDDPIVIE